MYYLKPHYINHFIGYMMKLNMFFTITNILRYNVFTQCILNIQRLYHHKCYIGLYTHIKQLNNVKQLTIMISISEMCVGC